MAIETNAGDVLNFVNGYVAHLAGDNDGTFSTFTAPKAEDLIRIIDITATEILSWVSDAGYDNDTTAWSSAAKDYFGWYNAIGACYRLEITHPGMTIGLGENSRLELFERIYNEFRKQLMEGSSLLSSLGILQSGNLQPTFTGRLISAKDADRQNTDAVQPFFTRDKFRHPGLRPSLTDPPPI